MKAVGIIPARWESKRFPGKILHPILGKPMIQWVYERASKSRWLDSVYIATDNELVAEACSRFNARSIMTSRLHFCGMNRCAEASKTINADVIVIIQGDEPCVNPRAIDMLSHYFTSPYASSASLMHEVGSVSDAVGDSKVKVVVGMMGNALYFSRSMIPSCKGQAGRVYVHIGVYAFRKGLLGIVSGLKPGNLEVSENLEQLRVLEYGYRMNMVVSPYRSVGVDLPEDVERAEQILYEEVEKCL